MNEYLIFYDENNIELKKIDISELKNNCFDVYYFLTQKHIFSYCINYIQSHINNIKSNINSQNIYNRNNIYNVNVDLMDDLIATKKYVELKNFYLEEINKLNKILENNNTNISINDLMLENDKILINKLEQIKYSFMEFNSNFGNYYIILLI
jgi:hypothetical protein